VRPSYELEGKNDRRRTKSALNPQTPCGHDPARLVFTTSSRSLKYVSGEQLDVGMDRRAAAVPHLLGVGARFVMSDANPLVLSVYLAGQMKDGAPAGTLPAVQNHVLIPSAANSSANTPPPALLNAGPKDAEETSEKPHAPASRVASMKVKLGWGKEWMN
jgi:hypothetical protein